MENPISAPDYAQRYGMSSQNVLNNFWQTGTINDGSNFITRYAPPVGANEGGCLEVVTQPKGVQISAWCMP